MMFAILVLSLLTWSCHSLTVKDLLPCKDIYAPMINSVVLVNCTEEPCFFGKDNGLSMQFIITPEKPAATVSSEITAENIWGVDYPVEAKQRTSCAYSYCQLEPKVPRCFSSVVRRKKQPSENEAEMYRFKVKFMNQNGKLIACSRFLLGTYIKLKKTHKPVSYKPYAYTTPYDSYSSYKPSYGQVAVELPKPSYSYSSAYNYDYKPYSTVKDETPAIGPVEIEEEETDEEEFRNSTAPAGPEKPLATGEASNWQDESDMVYLEDVPNVVEAEPEEEVPPFEDFARGKGLIFNDSQASGQASLPSLAI